MIYDKVLRFEIVHIIYSCVRTQSSVRKPEPPVCQPTSLRCGRCGRESVAFYNRSAFAMCVCFYVCLTVYWLGCLISVIKTQSGPQLRSIVLSSITNTANSCALFMLCVFRQSAFVSLFFFFRVSVLRFFHSPFFARSLTAMRSAFFTLWPRRRGSRPGAVCRSKPNLTFTGLPEAFHTHTATHIRATLIVRAWMRFCVRVVMRLRESKPPYASVY